jgi:hypothetical protein
MNNAKLATAEERRAYDARLRAGLKQYRAARKLLSDARVLGDMVIAHCLEQRAKVRTGETLKYEASIYDTTLEMDAGKTAYKLAQELLKRMR